MEATREEFESEEIPVFYLIFTYSINNTYNKNCKFTFLKYYHRNSSIAFVILKMLILGNIYGIGRSVLTLLLVIM